MDSGRPADFGDMFIAVGVLPDLMRVSQTGFSIDYMKDPDMNNLSPDYDGTPQECTLNLMPRKSQIGRQRDDRQNDDAAIGTRETRNDTKEEEKERDIWCDGINFLLGTDMSENANSNQEQSKRSKAFNEEFKALLEVEMRMNLLNPTDTFNFDSLPKIPPPPPNYNFVNYKVCPETKRVMKKELPV